MTNPIQIADRTEVSPHWVLFSLAAAAGHLLLLVICFCLLPGSLWSMDNSGGGYSVVEMIAMHSFLILNFPLGIAGVLFNSYFQLPMIAALPWIIANGVVWGLTIHLLFWSFFRARKYKSTVLGHRR